METKSTFDEHIEYLEEKIADNKKCITECNEEITEYEKELEQVKQDKEDFLKNGTYEPSIYLKGIAEEKKEITNLRMV